MSHFDYMNILDDLEKKGREAFGSHFQFSKENFDVLQKMACFFMLDEKLCAKFNISLQKGIILSGNVGVGKTTLMKLFNTLSLPEVRYQIKSSRDISFEFGETGYSVISRYSTFSFKENRSPKNFCFDDLGSEESISYFGNQCNVMREILTSRYDYFVYNNMKTFITTNLSSTEIEELYGIRVRSRLREMCNVISFDRTTPDKRK